MAKQLGLPVEVCMCEARRRLRTRRQKVPIEGLQKIWSLAATVIARFGEQWYRLVDHAVKAGAGLGGLQPLRVVCEGFFPPMFKIPS